MIDLGKVRRGDTKAFSYSYKNEGTESLILEFVDSCECTTVEWSDEPVLPGQTGTIQAVFDSTNEERIKEGDINLVFKNLDPETGNPMLVVLQYRAEILD